MNFYLSSNDLLHMTHIPLFHICLLLSVVLVIYTFKMLLYTDFKFCVDVGFVDTNSFYVIYCILCQYCM